MVVAAREADGQGHVIAVPLDPPGVQVAPHSRLLAVQATRSSSLVLERAQLPATLAMSSLDSCLPRVRPTLLALQSCFCLGLARAALGAAETGIHRGSTPYSSNSWTACGRRWLALTIGCASNSCSPTPSAFRCADSSRLACAPLGSPWPQPDLNSHSGVATPTAWTTRRIGAFAKRHSWLSRRRRNHSWNRNWRGTPRQVRSRSNFAVARVCRATSRGNDPSSRRIRRSSGGNGAGASIDDT
jgi:hypothetical protein